MPEVFIKNGKKFIQHWHVITAYLVIYDFIAIVISYFLALWLRFELRFDGIPREYWDPYIRYISVYAILCIIVFWRMRLYKSIWRFAGYHELFRMTVATIVTGFFHLAYTLAFEKRMPISYYVGGLMFQFTFTLGIRFAYRFILLLRGNRDGDTDFTKRVMVIGAGEAGQMILRDIKHTGIGNEKVYCIIDDNPNKWGRYIDGVKIYGNRECILEAARKYGIEKIYVAIPSATRESIREILNICKETGCELKNLPGMYQFRTGEVHVSHMKEVSIEDLLGREQIMVNMDEIYGQIKDKVILITGGGGSIGSELCRQVAAHHPKQLIIFDIYENNAYAIQLELRKKYPELDLVTLIGSVRDSRKIFQVFELYHPQLVYHAAAHKHVPLMEDSPCEAIKNNAIGTYKTAFAAMAHGCERFVLISTDKAVNPTNIMGASKRLCEMIIQAFDKKIKEGKAEEIPQLFTHWSTNLTTDEEVGGTIKNARTELTDIDTVNVDAEMDNDAKIKDYIKQMKNPYCYRSNGMVVKIGFTGKKSLEECLATCFSMEQVNMAVAKVG